MTSISISNRQCIHVFNVDMYSPVCMWVLAHNEEPISISTHYLKLHKGWIALDTALYVRPSFYPKFMVCQQTFENRSRNTLFMRTVASQSADIRRGLHSYSHTQLASDK